MDYQRDKWNNQTYTKHGFVLPQNVDPFNYLPCETTYTSGNPKMATY